MATDPANPGLRSEPAPTPIAESEHRALTALLEGAGPFAGPGGFVQRVQVFQS